jgi:D-serine deaminase-like pyridoxal phosphate-dependent protein
VTAAWAERLPHDVETPALLVDVGVLERNLSRMARWASASGLGLRPHAKTHKCVPVARRQLAHGATGLTVATVGEAEHFADAGVHDLFIAYPLWADGARAQRLAALARRVHLRVGVDSAEGAAALGELVRGGGGADPEAPGGDIEVLVEVDSGQHRSGVPPSQAPVVAAAAARSGLMVRGVFTFPGHSYAPGASVRVAAQESATLAEAAALLDERGFDTSVRSGGSTPTARHSDASSLNEVRPGVYAFNDAQQIALGTCTASDVALVALATVVSTPAADRFVLDAGSKTVGADRPPWAAGFGLLPDHPGTIVSALSEHHAVVSLDTASGAPLPAVGSRVAVVPNHVCNAVVLADELLAVEGADVVERWPVAPRRANR